MLISRMHAVLYRILLVIAERKDSKKLPADSKEEKLKMSR